MTDKTKGSPYRHFDYQCWPVPCETLSDLERALRFMEGEPLSVGDRLVTASVVAAYVRLIMKPSVRRDAIIRELRKGPGYADE